MMLALLAAASVLCGVDRWPVKTLTDPAAKSVNLRAHKTTIAALRARPAPKYSDRAPRWPAETETVTLTASIVGFMREDDSDLHVVVADQQGNTMVVEFPNPECMVGSRVLKQATAARAALLALVPRPSSTFKRLVKPVPVKLTGVVFFDSLHGQTGAAPNGVELHPVTAIIGL